MEQSTMKEIFYVKVNGWWVGVFFSDGDSCIAKKSLSKINPTFRFAFPKEKSIKDVHTALFKSVVGALEVTTH